LVSEPGLRLKPELAGLTDYELSRQCSGAVLERALRRRLLLHSLLRAPAVKRLLSQLHQVPSVPRLYLKLLEEVQSPQHSLDGVAAIVRQDPAMTAKILQLVNSPYFALSREIRDTAEAVLFLGLERIRSLVLMVHFFTSFESSRKYQWFSVEQLWQHSFATANLAAEMAEHETKDPDFVSETYSAGLLHDLGKLVLAANIPDRYERIVHAAKTSQTPVWKTERDQLGATHAELGGALAGLWQLPLSIVEAIAFHHRPSDSGNRRFSPLALVHLADVFENETAATPYESRADLEYLEVLGRTDLLELWKKLMELKSSGESTRRPRH
jgi:putative nucleotidyltransferase with HDIG domain